MRTHDSIGHHRNRILFATIVIATLLLLHARAWGDQRPRLAAGGALAFLVGPTRPLS